ncbi:hypothetical protein BDA99DRAFT_593767 [Phascolomyces articulosus]|uniref:Uncharacterized protein n=1 Tax=Phascolomyces articulosus TaxID=60185 RepID=A0AAD5JM05_9FUNG|nr:hypothetical protein BDA99DRAFT_593767 [Phascolomyces articulosus]
MDDTQPSTTPIISNKMSPPPFTPNSSTPNMTLSSASMVETGGANSSQSTTHLTNTEQQQHQLLLQRDEWEAMFDPQYTHLRRLTPRKDVSPGPSPAETPTLPRIDYVKVQAPCPDQIDILPCPSESFAKHQRNEARLGFLKTIREQGLTDRHDTWKLMDQREPHRNWQERLQEKINEDQDFDSPPHLPPIAVVATAAPSHLMNPSSVVMDSHDHGNDINKAEKKSIATTMIHTKKNDKKPIRRRSFLYFAFGFLFPPLWIIGALHVPPQRHHPGSQAVDLLWKRRSRNAFFIFILTVLVILILTLVLKPSSIGWRTSSNSVHHPPSSSTY